jgi:hypothetical protein
MFTVTTARHSAGLAIACTKLGPSSYGIGTKCVDGNCDVHCSEFCSYKICIAELKLNGVCSSYLFRSGNAEHPSDRFYNTSVEVLPVSSHTSLSRIDHNATSDGFVIIGLYVLW